jgi:transcriptional regulator with XRE-family HTH domain
MMTDVSTSEFDQQIGATIKDLRTSKGLSQASLVAEVARAGVDGFHQTTLSRIESGERSLRLHEARAVAIVLTDGELHPLMLPIASDLMYAYRQRAKAEDLYMEVLDRLESIAAYLAWAEYPSNQEKFEQHPELERAFGAIFGDLDGLIRGIEANVRSYAANARAKLAAEPESHGE